MMLINGHGAALMPSQAHAKPNKEGMLGAFVTERIERSKEDTPGLLLS